MRIYCRSEQQKRLERSDWHRWFAWRPVRIDYQKIIWLESIERICYYSYGEHCHSHYREPEPKQEDVTRFSFVPTDNKFLIGFIALLLIICL